MAKQYFKLGEKSTTFVDPKSGTHIIGKEVVAVDQALTLQSRNFQEALRNGHIAKADKEEFDAFQSTQPKPAPPAATAQVTTASTTTASTGTTDADDEDDEDEDEEDDEDDEEKEPKKPAGRGRGRK